MEKTVSVKIIRSDSKTFLLDGTDWKIPSDGLDGFGSVDNNLTTVDNAIGEGSVLSSRRIDKKDRTIKAMVSNPILNDVLRRAATGFFNPKFTYDVYVTYMGVTRWATGELYRFSCPMKNIFERVELQVTFLFLNPFLRSVENFGENIASITAMAGFPYLCTAETGAATGIFNFAQMVVLENDGDVESYCKAVFRAKGEVVNPKLMINERYVRVLDTMQDGDMILIDFTQNPPVVEKNGSNIIGKTDKTSSFDGMELAVGGTEIRFDADTGSNLLEVSIYYNKLYASM